MKKLLLFGGLLAIMIAFTSMAFRASPKEKPDTPIVYVAFEQVDFAVIEVPRETEYRPSGYWSHAILEDLWEPYLAVPYNDPYLMRPQRWIKQRNLQINSLIDTFDSSNKAVRFNLRT